MTECVYNTPDCGGRTWECRTCHRKFCMTHANVTSLGANVECIECEDKRLDPPPPREPDLRHLDKQVEIAVTKVEKSKP